MFKGLAYKMEAKFKMKVFDLTMPIDERTPVFPGDRPHEIRQAATVAKNGWNEKWLSFNSHFGTHIDAPAHMIQGGKTLSDFPISHFVGEAVMIRLDDDLDSVKPDDIVFFYTGQTEKLYAPDFFKNNPVIDETLAEKLVAKKVRMIGIDSFTPDNNPYPTHKILLGANIMIVENLVNLRPLLGKRFQCVIAPLKIEGSDGAPCRVMAII